MPKYLYPLILFIIFVIAGVAVWQSRISDTSTAPVLSQPLLVINPNHASPDTNGDVHLHIVLHSAKIKADTVQFTLFYDPQSLQFRDIQPENSFADGQILKKIINDNGYKCCHKTGYIQYALKGKSQQTNGDVSIVSLTFHALRQSGQTGVHFTEAQVNSEDISQKILLNSKYNNIIKFGVTTK